MSSDTRSWNSDPSCRTSSAVIKLAWKLEYEFDGGSCETSRTRRADRDRSTSTELELFRRTLYMSSWRSRVLHGDNEVTSLTNVDEMSRFSSIGRSSTTIFSMFSLKLVRLTSRECRPRRAQSDIFTRGPPLAWRKFTPATLNNRRLAIVHSLRQHMTSVTVKHFASLGSTTKETNLCDLRMRRPAAVTGDCRMTTCRRHALLDRNSSIVWLHSVRHADIRDINKSATMLGINGCPKLFRRMTESVDTSSSLDPGCAISLAM